MPDDTVELKKARLTCPQCGHDFDHLHHLIEREEDIGCPGCGVTVDFGEWDLTDIIEKDK